MRVERFKAAIGFIFLLITVIFTPVFVALTARVLPTPPPPVHFTDTPSPTSTQPSSTPTFTPSSTSTAAVTPSPSLTPLPPTTTKIPPFGPVWLKEAALLYQDSTGDATTGLYVQPYGIWFACQSQNGRVQIARTDCLSPSGWVPVELVQFVPTPTITQTPSATPTVTQTPANTATATPLVSTPGTSPFPYPVETQIHGAAMIFIPAGTFAMGSDSGNSDHQPAHSVSLNAFYIDKFEVSLEDYNRCVTAGACQPPDPLPYLDPKSYADRPAVNLTWQDARDYCSWRDAALPSEAQWEKAARGSDGRAYPWGNSAPDCSLANYGNKCRRGLSPVDSYPVAASPYGVINLAGNTMEWVADVYDPDYYAGSPTSDPTGPEAGKERVVRGGGWTFPLEYLATYARWHQDPERGYANVGFRCVVRP